jgi:RNA polymerase sigma-70 factor (ECF subfamily)
MLRAKAGDLTAFEGLVRHYQKPLVNYFLRMGVYRDAEDKVQETFIRVFNYRDRYKPTAKFRTFLYTVARNVWLDGLRRTKRAEAFIERLEQEAPPTDDGGIAQVHSRMDVRSALARLPEKLRDVVILAVYQGLRYGDVAEALEIPVGTVKSRMFLAIERLKEVLGETRT